MTKLLQTWAVLVLGGNFHFYAKTEYFRNELEEPLLHCWYPMHGRGLCVMQLIFDAAYVHNAAYRTAVL